MRKLETKLKEELQKQTSAVAVWEECFGKKETGEWRVLQELLIKKYGIKHDVIKMIEGHLPEGVICKSDFLSLIKS